MGGEGMDDPGVWKGACAFRLLYDTRFWKFQHGNNKFSTLTLSPVVFINNISCNV